VKAATCSVSLQVAAFAADPANGGSCVVGTWPLTLRSAFVGNSLNDATSEARIRSTRTMGRSGCDESNGAKFSNRVIDL